MSDLIDRKQAIDAMGCLNDSICEQQAVDALWELPAAEKTGKWIKLDDCNTVQCSKCLEGFDYIYGLCYLCYNQELPNYCPNCGAKMVNEDE